MPAYNFKLRFANDIRKKRKRQTIRKERRDKWIPRVGMTASCFINMRTRFCERLGDFPIKEVYKIEINEDNLFKVQLTDSENVIRYIERKNRDKFARADGFANYKEFINFFKYHHGFPFKGILIKW